MKIQLVDENLGRFIDFNKEYNKVDPKFEVGDHVSLSKYKKRFAKLFVLYWSEDVFMIKKVTNTVPWTFIISYINDLSNVWNR